MSNSKFLKLDWVLILLYIALVIFGYFNVYASSISEDIDLDFIRQRHSKHLLFIFLCIPVIIFILILNSKIIKRYSSLFYLIGLIALFGLIFFGKEIAGERSWYNFGGISLQPSEFLKPLTALALAKYLIDIQVDLKEIKHQIRAVAIVMIPAIFILLVNSDEGSAIVFIFMLMTLFLAGLNRFYLIIALLFFILAILTLKYGFISLFIVLLLIILFIGYKNIFQFKRFILLKYLSMFLMLISFSFMINYIYKNHKLEKHQEDRITIWLRVEKDAAKLEKMRNDINYNGEQALIAIGSGSWTGKGWKKGDSTQGNFVPEQQTDYIFTTVGEEWGFLGSSVLVIFYILLIMRIYSRAENSKDKFTKYLGYSLASTLFIHFVINVGMVLGLVLVIGIPLPFFSYGGSSLLAFTLFLFIFINFEASE